MSRRRFAPQAFLALSGAALLVGVAATVGAGCSTTTEVYEPGDASDASTDKPKVDSAPAQEPDTGPPPPTEEECIADCRTKHSAGAAKDKLIEDCWETKCKGPCIDETGVFDAGADGGDAGDAGDGGGPACKNPVETDDTSCDLCTKVNCCASWDGCFDDQDCSALNECIGDCIQ
jgi:hypothetical protein